MQAAAKGHASPRWLTYRQAAELGGQVRRGEKSATVVKYGTVEKEGEDGARETRPFLRAYHVFNATQVDGLPEDFAALPAPVDLSTLPIAALDAYWSRLGARIETSPEPRACYEPARDRIHMPPVATFHTAATYYETLGHEVDHHAARPVMPRGSRGAQARLAGLRDRAA